MSDKKDNLEMITEYNQVTLKRDNLPSLSFQGKHLATAIGDIEAGLWVESALWISIKGNVICQKQTFSQRIGERVMHEAKVCKNSSEVARFLNYDQDYGAGHGEVLYLIANELDFVKNNGPQGLQHAG
mgnify:CR=1 FL=1